MSDVSTREVLQYILRGYVVGANGEYLYNVCTTDTKSVRYYPMHQLFNGGLDVTARWSLDNIRSRIKDEYKDDLELAILEMEMLNS